MKNRLELIRELHAFTNVPISDCKREFDNAKGDYFKAVCALITPELFNEKEKSFRVRSMMGKSILDPVTTQETELMDRLHNYFLSKANHSNYFKSFSKEYFSKFISNFYSPDISKKTLISDDKVGLIFLPVDRFKYDPKVGYEFEFAIVCEDNSDNKLLFIRIDQYNPKYRQENPPDYCIPIAQEGLSEEETITRSIPFGGGWSDCGVCITFYIDKSWVEWIKDLQDGIAFTNEESESAAFFKFNDRSRKYISEFCS